ncbi:hypothetical protein K491DRAFT_664029 [Lophiostoma macrostomum CBS 122681]|uniref:Uncharacterized protein n=1 Tax=Lophiostoma macrostomum CBS 122681 TaxID=1314788 RepID=A0A6A6SZD4_9PLEO|nr:hypothetical protein K491DRAFT_664029 [Lophiostoma macrostomum CBS 122681]
METTTAAHYPVNGRVRPWSIGSELLGHYDVEQQPANGTPSSTPDQQANPVGPVKDEEDLQAHPGLLRTSTTFYDRLITDWWWWELFSWLVSFLCVSAIVGVLLLYSGKKQPDFIIPGITINAFISVFAAVAKAALILPVSEAIGQLKWIWFQNDANLWDIDLFDGASRGPWGSMMLLLKSKCRHIVSLGAAITILALAFEPFFQQIVVYPERSVPVDQGTVSTAVTLDRQMAGSNSVKVAIDTVLMTNDIATRSAPSLCQTANCTWPFYSTLGLCHKCQDVSYLLEHTSCKEEVLPWAQVQTEVRRPCGYTLNNTFAVGRTAQGLETDRRQVVSLSTFIVGNDATPGPNISVWNTTVFHNMSLPIADFYVAYTPGGPSEVLKNATPVLQECVINWCSKVMQSAHFGGLLHDEVVETFPLDPGSQPGFIYDIYGHSPLSFSGPDNRTVAIGNGTTNALRAMIVEDIPQVLSQLTDFAFVEYTSWNFHQVAPYDIKPFLNNLTTYVSDTFRSVTNATEMVKGTAWAPEQFVSIRWEWIALPVLLLFSSLLLVLVTIFKSRRGGTAAWKSSVLATLLHGLTDDVRDKFDPRLSPSEIEVISRRLRVKLKTDGGNTNISLA